MKNIKFVKNSIAFSIIEFIIGIILLFRPEGFTSAIIIAIGCMMIVSGVISTVRYFRCERSEAMNTNLLSRGLLLLIAGCFFVFNSTWFIVTFAVTTVLYGILMLFIGVIKFQNAIDGIRFKLKYRYINLIGAVLTLAAAILIIVNPFVSAQFIWKFIAVSMLVEAVMDIVSYCLIKGSKE